MPTAQGDLSLLEDPVAQPLLNEQPFTSAVPTFSWDLISGVTSYTIYLTDQTSGVTTTYTNLAGPSAAPTSALTLGDSYIWWVGAVQGQNTAWSSGQRVYVDGTSASAPLVSGAIAAVMSLNPSLTPQQAAQLITRTASDAGAPGVDHEP